MKKSFSLFFVFIPLFLAAAVGNWQTFTNSSEIRQFTIADSIIWSATNGGVLRVNANTKDYKKFTNTEGLAQIDVVAIAHDPNGFVWVAMPDGLLQILNIETGRWDMYNEFQNKLSVYSIMPYENVVLVGFDKGIAELRLDDNDRWERTWKAEIGSVRDILITGEYIWVAQDDGIRRIDVDFPNKQIPGAWEHFGVNDGLPNAQVNTLLAFNTTIVAGTQTGLAHYDGSAWFRTEFFEHNVKSLCEWKNQLTMASNIGVYAQTGDDSWSRLGSVGGNTHHVDATGDNVLWLGTTDAGLFEYDGETTWTSLVVNCPGSNTFSDLLVDRDGHLWATSTKKPTGGVYYFDGNSWTNFTRKTGLASYDYRTVEEDVFGRIWAGSWGGGVTLFEKTEHDSIKVTNLYNMDGNLSGVGAASSYVVITDLVSDENGYMWFLNSVAGDKRVLHVYDLDSSWEHWTTIEGIRSDKVSALEIDNVGRKWIGTGQSDGTGASGISVLDDNGTPFDKSDDDLSGYLDESEGLESNNIAALAEDLDGTLWIGTTKGLNYWFGNVGARYNVINDNIQSLYVDPRNNKWIGTAGGLSVLDSDNFSWTHYTTSNSLLVSDIVTSFGFNEETGHIFIGTTNGLSRFETPFTKPASNLSSVKGYPNPFILEPSTSRFYIDNLALNSRVSIFTADGYLVKTIPRSEILGARVSWDGTNTNGEFVASGVYVYLVTTKDGQEKSGKIALIRR